MALYDSKITIFNYDVKTQEFKSELITKVECQKWYEINEEVGYNEDSDSMLVIIKFFINSDIKTTDNGKKFCYPQEYQDLENKAGFFTFNTYVFVTTILSIVFVMFAANIIFIVYDVNKESTFTNVKMWYDYIKESIDEKKVKFILIGISRMFLFTFTNEQVIEDNCSPGVKVFP